MKMQYMYEENPLTPLTSNQILNLVPDNKEEHEFLTRFRNMILAEAFTAVRNQIDTAQAFIR